MSFEVVKEICQTNGIDIKKIDTQGPLVSSLELFFNGFNRLSGLVHFPNLTKLVIFGSDLSLLTRFEFGFALTELWLCETNIRRIPDLKECANLMFLYMYNNSIKRIENLQFLKQLQILSLADNRIRCIENLSGLNELTELNLASNQIEQIGDCLLKLRKIESLNISGNCIESVTQLSSLQNLNLKELILSDCLYTSSSICKLTNYHLQIIYSLPKLEKLDNTTVTPQAVQDSIRVIKQKCTFYGMKKRVLERSLYILLKRIRKLSESRLKVPADAMKQLQAERCRVKELNAKKDKGTIAAAAIKHKYSLIEGRQNYWKEFYRKLKREQRNAFQGIRSKFDLDKLLIEIELQSGGNIRFEEHYESIRYLNNNADSATALTTNNGGNGTENSKPANASTSCSGGGAGKSPNVNSFESEDDYWELCSKLIRGNCSENRKAQFGIDEIQINRVVRIYHRLLRLRFDDALDQFNFSPMSQMSQSYLILQSDPSNIQTSANFIRGDMSRNSSSPSIFCTSLLDADVRLNRKDRKPQYPPPCAQLIICRVYLGRTVPHTTSSASSSSSSSNSSAAPLSSNSTTTKSTNSQQTNSQKPADVSPPNVDNVEVKKANYPNAESCSKKTEDGRIYWLFNNNYVLPEYLVEIEYIPKPQAFPPLIFHAVTDNRTSLYTPKPTQEQEDKDYEVCHSHPETSVPNLSDILSTHPSNLTSIDLIGVNLDTIPILVTLPHLKDLDISCNNIKHFENLKCSRALTSINVSHNLLVSIKMPELVKLTTLNASWNYLSNLDAVIKMVKTKSPNLESLNLHANLFPEGDEERRTILNVFDHLIAKLPKLKECQGQIIGELQRRSLKHYFNLGDSLLLKHGRIGEPERNMSMMNSSQYLSKYIPNERLNNSDIKNITSICLDNLGIDSITALSSLLSLKYISMAHNSISDINPLRPCVQLVEMIGRGNQIKNCEVVNYLVKIKQLDLAQNQIAEIPFKENLSSLVTLDFSNNLISSIFVLAKLPNIKELYLADNLISDCGELIQLKFMTGVDILDIDHNPFYDNLDGDHRLYILYHFPFLKALDGIPVENKEIQTAKDSFGGRLTNDFLTERFGYANGVAQVKLNAIEELDLQDCGIRSVHLDADRLSNLTSLNMIRNEMTHFSGLIYLKELKTICLNQNNIESLFPMTKNQRAHIHRSQYSQRDSMGSAIMTKLNISDDSPLLPKLEVLHVGYNKIKDITFLQLKRFPALKSLFLEGNELVKVDGLESCHDLRHLVLDRNRIKTIDANAFIAQWRLEELHLDGNRLIEMNNFHHLVNLKRLFIGMNRIQDIAEIQKLGPLTCLSEISLIGNGVARRTLHRPMLVWQMPNIQSIDGIKVSMDERHKAEMYFMEQATEHITMPDYEHPIPRQFGHVQRHQPSLSQILSHGYAGFPRAWQPKATSGNSNPSESPVDPFNPNYRKK